MVGATSNPTIFQKAMTDGDTYDEQLRDLGPEPDGARESWGKTTFWALATRDIADACDLFRPIWDGGSGRDGYVSLEVDPGLAYDSLRTYTEAVRLHDLIDRPNLMVKIPATKPGLAAIEDCIAEGRSINVTLIFALRRYAEVAESYVRGLERLVAAGGNPGPVASVASFFVSRIDSEADRRLDLIGNHDDLKGRLAIANARLAYQCYRDVFRGPRWEFLSSKGATPQRVLWASTSTKDPAYPDTLYVDELAGADTVNTMPEETIEQFHDHGQPDLGSSAAMPTPASCSVSSPAPACREAARALAGLKWSPRGSSKPTACARARRRSMRTSSATPPTSWRVPPRRWASRDCSRARRLGSARSHRRRRWRRSPDITVRS